MARRMETRHCAVCGKPFQAAVEGRRVNCPEHLSTRRNRLRAKRASSGTKYEPARPGERCTIGPSATTGKRCGKPGVVAFIGSRGERFVECEQHRSDRSAGS